MIKKFLSLFSAAVLLGSLCACSLTERDVVEVTKDVEVPPKMIFLGDSIAAGYGLEGYENGNNYECSSYSNILYEKYKTELIDICPHDMQNFAISGADSEDLLTLLNSGKLDSALAQTDAVVVSIGGNDMLGVMLGLLDTIGFSKETKSIDLDELDFFQAAALLMKLEENIDTALTEFEVNLKEIAAQINEKSDGKLFIQTLYDPIEALDKIPMLVDFANEKIGKFNDIIKNNSGESYIVVDVYPDFKGKCSDLTNIGELDIHPNAKGHELIAEAVDQSFRDTGFTYTGQEYGEPHLTKFAIILIVIGIIGIILILFLIPKLFKKHDP